jgi:large subunit ribosomal protein L17
MRHRKSTFKINRTGEHRRSLLANQVCSLLKEGRISTTVARAKVSRRLAEKMITLGKDGSLAARRRAIAVLHQVDTVHTLFKEIAPRYVDRHGGYTRIIRIGQRVGDAAEMCYLELVQEPVAATVSETPEAAPAAAVSPAAESVPATTAEAAPQA